MPDTPVPLKVTWHPASLRQSPHQVLPVMHGFALAILPKQGSQLRLRKNSRHLGGKRHQEGFFTFVILAQLSLLYHQYTKQLATLNNWYA